MFLQKFENTSVAKECLKNGKQFLFFFVIIFILLILVFRVVHCCKNNRNFVFIKKLGDLGGRTGSSMLLACQIRGKQ